MSIRLDPRRLGTLKQLAAEANTRPGDLVRHWVEERIDAARAGVATPEAASSLAERLDALAQRVAALETALGASEASETSEPAPAAEVAIPVEAPHPEDAEPSAADDGTQQPGPKRSPRKRVSAAPKTERVSLHEEMIAVLAERGPMPAADLAAAVAERGRYAPPRSGKPLDAAMVSQRVSNPTYRSRFTRSEGRIGLAKAGD
jgi:chemotaxis protein histidine kinase CheA